MILKKLLRLNNFVFSFLAIKDKNPPIFQSRKLIRVFLPLLIFGVFIVDKLLFFPGEPLGFPSL